MYSLVKLISLLIVVDCICHHNQCSERNCYLTVYLFSTTHGIFFFMFQKNGVLAENENANVQSVKDVVRRFELGTYSPCIDSFEH